VLGSFRSLGVSVAMEVLLGCLILYVHCYGAISYVLGLVALMIYLASCGRIPADLSESESEFVAGTVTKHGSAGYLLVSLVE
jgi:NADH:ubiquinone oxidoreductase subunit H